LRIALLSTFVPSTMWSDAHQMIQKMEDHILNRECYCHLWKYDCIFNQTVELGHYARLPEDGIGTPDAAAAAAASSNTTSDPWWLKFGAWERVAHLQAALPKYDWVLYGDVDYIIKDLSRPIESFIREFELYGKDDVHVLVPVDDNEREKRFAFSTFAVLIKNSSFGRRLLENWRAYGMGLCPNGNFEDVGKRKGYSWEHSDQPGLWYALMKTHMDFNPNDKRSPDIVSCNETTGLIAASKDFWFDIDGYFFKNGYRIGNYGEDLDKVQDEQQIIWSRSHNDSMSGLGVQLNWRIAAGERFSFTAFAVHLNRPSITWDLEVQIELRMCKQVHGCFVSWNETMGVQAGCAGRNSSNQH